jgi:hypothetical protein
MSLGAGFQSSLTASVTTWIRPCIDLLSLDSGVMVEVLGDESADDGSFQDQLFG